MVLNLKQTTFTQRLCTMIRKRSELRNVSYRQPLEVIYHQTEMRLKNKNTRIITVIAIVVTILIIVLADMMDWKLKKVAKQEFRNEFPGAEIVNITTYDKHMDMRAVNIEYRKKQYETPKFVYWNYHDQGRLFKKYQRIEPIIVDTTKFILE
jgi:hypothetical protein